MTILVANIGTSYLAIEVEENKYFCPIDLERREIDLDDESGAIANPPTRNPVSRGKVPLSFSQERETGFLRAKGVISNR